MLSDYKFTIGELFESYYDCRKNKRNKKECLKFELNLEHNLVELYEELEAGTWLPRTATVFAVKYPKPREIWAADRIVHHIIYRALSPKYQYIFIPNTFACIKGRGTMRAIEKAQNYINSNNGFILKCDVASFFNSINKNILYEKLKNDIGISSPFMLKLIEKVIFQDLKNNYRIANDISIVPPHKSLFNASNHIGLPIESIFC